MPRLPNFLVIGAPKSGTTSLYFYLKQHPDVFLPLQKELHYFSYEILKKSAKGPGDDQIINSLCASREEYERHYCTVKREKAIGEISPSYLYYGVHDSIWQELGSVKIVVMLRNPVDKAYSQYMHMVRDQHEKLPFYEALKAEKNRRSAGWSDIWRYAESSLYTDRLKGFMDCFGRENVHVILFDDFIADPQESMRKLLFFLKVDTNVPLNTNETYNRTGKPRSKFIASFLNQPSFMKTAIKHFTPDAWRIALRMRMMDINTAGKPAIDQDAADYLFDYFAEDIQNLEKLLSRSLDWHQHINGGKGK